MAKTFPGSDQPIASVVATRSFKQVNGVQHCKAIVHQVAAIKICRVAGGGIGIDQQDIGLYRFDVHRIGSCPG